MKRLLLLAPLLLGGCLSAPDLTALAADKNSDCFTETSVWVTFSIERNFGCHYPPPGFTLVPIAAAK